ncbi:mast cell protease 1A-like [Mauremys mutica]|uniref:mast cell protease 1A-like n=1 Tax=Mauremys mutica TaxID=74926 RepID=UPI001D164A0B|nr:mast cell protease 1A-like [Mauremys mutica]
MVTMLILILLPVAFLLPPGTGAGEIIGGWEAKPHSRPYMAYLEIQRGDKSSFCGGFLVSKNFVLTAAHCNGDKITVSLGDHNRKRVDNKLQKITVSGKISHENYNKTTYNNDIMLLQLAERAKLNTWVKTIDLPLTRKRVKPGMKCSVAGWGRTVARNNSTTSTTLQEVDVEVLKDDECMYSHYNASTMMCVGDPEKGKDSAKGDSGGPLVCGKMAQGIVSWGPYRPPGVYTRLSTFISWIQAMMRRLQP